MHPFDAARSAAERIPTGTRASHEATTVPYTRPGARPSARSRSAVRQQARLTRRGRIVAVLVFLALALAVMTALSGWATATREGGAPTPVRVVTVAPGDTLYGIAADLAKPGEIRTMVHRIQELNSLPGAELTEGQKLAVPRG